MSHNLIGTYVQPTQDAKHSYPPLAKITRPAKIVGFSSKNANFLEIEGLRGRWHVSLFEGVAPPDPPKAARALDRFL